MTDHATPLILNCRRCGQVTTWQNNPSRPFCSERCKLIDLGAWASEQYTIPLAEAPAHIEAEND
ncbi:DNA gyrase inhibitor YacG [Agitococcus lubricus]|uniref:DNA gyrase inhibitor YacG n=1 Tax=Agitococcus lubricus TaxID=1077255 RepID=A0A2T5J2A5_9GAMM|nr:DNA gyrase inhibitor YacG [Agitococcus lubricus]PTQ90648.1 hypothetical protein C8N29_10247 [Agitococcus lubricus]